LQENARALEIQTGIKPVPPDLWLIDRQGNHRFIEVKLPGDRLQLSVLAYNLGNLWRRLVPPRRSIAGR
jgi:hypothetical protein